MYFAVCCLLFAAFPRGALWIAASVFRCCCFKLLLDSEFWILSSVFIFSLSTVCCLLSAAFPREALWIAAARRRFGMLLKRTRYNKMHVILTPTRPSFPTEIGNPLWTGCQGAGMAQTLTAFCCKTPYFMKSTISLFLYDDILTSLY